MPFRPAAMILAALLAALPAEPVYAQTGKASAEKSAAAALPITPDRPGQWREPVSRDDPQGYRCLRGPASSPRCAIANRMTCEVLGPDNRGAPFCTNAYRHALPQPRTFASFDDFLDLYYRIDKVRIATSQDIEAAKRHRYWKDPPPDAEPRRGDLLVKVRRRICEIRPCPMDLVEFLRIMEHMREWPSEESAEYCLRHEDGRWRLVWWPYEVPFDEGPAY